MIFNFNKKVVRPIEKVSRKAAIFIMESESFREKAYLCPGNIWTIGYGSTKDVKRGDTITEPEARRRFYKELESYEQEVTRLLKRKPTQGQYDALVSFNYNLGINNLKTSKLLKNYEKGEFAQAALQFSEWIFAGGQIKRGLVRRRAKEALVFLDLI